MQTDVNHQLKTKFNYVIPGQGEEEAQFIVLKCPGMPQIKLTSVIRQLFTRALREAQTNRDATLSQAEIDAEMKEEDEEDEEQDESDLDGDPKSMEPRQAMIILESSSVDMQRVIDVCTRLFLSKGIALVDGETPLTDTLIKRLSIDDFYDLMGAMIGNFIVASLMS